MIIDTAHEGQLVLVENILTDQSSVYDVKLNNVTIYCTDEMAAIELFNTLSNESVYSFDFDA